MNRILILTASIIIASCSQHTVIKNKMINDFDQSVDSGNFTEEYLTKSSSVRCKNDSADLYSRIQSPKRTIESIQEHIDVRTSDIYLVYRIAERDNPNLKGTICLKLTISPDGKVSSSTIEFSDLDNLEFEVNVMKVMDSVNFGKYDVPTITLLYPLNFIPTGALYY
ncbi:MAG: AgmX/PglI C-terminal domain-containing protein [Colwellia sp.]|nr:AgmX/PglI C-terminal domain-containing protein [Colwellia sp.]